jgi:hypothetical protein
MSFSIIRLLPSEVSDFRRNARFSSIEHWNAFIAQRKICEQRGVLLSQQSAY